MAKKPWHPAELAILTLVSTMIVVGMALNLYALLSWK